MRKKLGRRKRGIYCIGKKNKHHQKTKKAEGYLEIDVFCQQLLPGKKREQLGIFYKACCVYVWEIQRETLDEWVRPKWLNAFHELSISKHCLTQRAAGLENASWKSLFFSSSSAFYNPHDSPACFPVFSRLYCHFFLFFHLNRADAPYLPLSSFTSALFFIQIFFILSLDSTT